MLYAPVSMSHPLPPSSGSDAFILVLILPSSGPWDPTAPKLRLLRLAHLAWGRHPLLRAAEPRRLFPAHPHCLSLTRFSLSQLSWFTGSSGTRPNARPKSSMGSSTPLRWSSPLWVSLGCHSGKVTWKDPHGSPLPLRPLCWLEASKSSGLAASCSGGF